MLFLFFMLFALIVANERFTKPLRAYVCKTKNATWVKNFKLKETG